MDAHDVDTGSALPSTARGGRDGPHTNAAGPDAGRPTAPRGPDPETDDPAAASGNDRPTTGRRRDADAEPDQQPGGRRRRADAERNIAAILDAALTCLAERPQANMTEIARTAGVGRVTLYAHFPSRQALLDAALDRALAETSAVIEPLHLDDQPADQSLAALIGSSWQVLDRYRRLYQVVQQEISPEDLRERHDPALARIRALVTRGQDEGVFRTDLPLDWLVTTVYSLTHAAADEANAGPLDPTDTARILQATLLAALTPPVR